MLDFFNNNQKDITILRWIIFFCCLLHSSSYASEYGHIWGEKNKKGTWRPKFYKVQHRGLSPIDYPEKCESKLCVSLHFGCEYVSDNEQEKFRASIFVERHPHHPKRPNPFKVPSYSPKASIWLNDQKFQVSLERSSLLYSFLYEISYFWIVRFDAELFDIIPTHELRVQIESEEERLKTQAVFDLSKEQEDIKHIKSICPPSGEKEEETEKKPPAPLIDPKKLF